MQAVTLQTRISSEARLRSSAIASTSYTATCGPGHAQRGDALIAAAKVHSSQVFSGVSGTRRRIIMMRHAESEDATENVRDHDRAITEMGRSAAQQVLSSPAPLSDGSQAGPIPFILSHLSFSHTILWGSGPFIVVIHDFRASLKANCWCNIQQSKGFSLCIGMD